jgi:MoaA/NifB/PqqE/SkfB family radical SAM enzyme
MKNISVVLRLTRYCNLNCPHCYIEASPHSNNWLKKKEVKLALNDLLRLKRYNIKDFRLTGGEITTLPYIKKIILIIREALPHTCLRFETNGIKFLEDNELERILSNINILHISIDTWHKNVNNKGESEILDYFLKKKYFYNYKILVHWVSNQQDKKLKAKFIKKYCNQDISIEFGEVSRVGRARNLNNKFLARRMSKRTKCSFGKFIMLDTDGQWYGCRVATKFTLLGHLGDRELEGKIDELLNKRRFYKVDNLGFLVIKENLTIARINRLFLQSKGIICDLCQEINS